MFLTQCEWSLTSFDLEKAEVHDAEWHYDEGLQIYHAVQANELFQDEVDYGPYDEFRSSLLYDSSTRPFLNELLMNHSLNPSYDFQLLLSDWLFYTRSPRPSVLQHQCHLPQVHLVLLSRLLLTKRYFPWDLRKMSTLNVCLKEEDSLQPILLKYLLNLHPLSNLSGFLRICLDCDW